MSAERKREKIESVGMTRKMLRISKVGSIAFVG